MKGRSISTETPLVILMAFLGTVITTFGFYDPAVQRWVNRDPIQEQGGINVYAYVLNDSVNAVDPLGLELASYPVITKPDPSCVGQCDAEFDDCLNTATLICSAVGGLAGASQVYNKTAIKPRGGVAGGGPSGRYTSRTRLKYGKGIGRTIGRISVGTAAAAGAVVADMFGVTSCATKHGVCVSKCPTVPDIPPIFNTSQNSPPIIQFP